MSLLKYMEQVSELDGDDLHWGRLSEDSLPFLGSPPMLSDEEFDALTDVSMNYHNGFFDVNDGEQNKAFLEIMDRCANGWYRLQTISRFVNGTTKHYLEWAVPYRMATPGVKNGRYNSALGLKQGS